MSVLRYKNKENNKRLVDEVTCGGNYHECQPALIRGKRR